MSLSLTSTAFANNGLIPSLFTCDGNEYSPPLEISGVPEAAKSLVLVMDDQDIPATVKTKLGIEKFDHWVLYNLPPDTRELVPGTQEGTLGLNSQGLVAYISPCPPPEHEPTVHRYVFRLYALSKKLHFTEPPTLDEVEAAAQEWMLAKTELTGRYTRVTE